MLFDNSAWTESQNAYISFHLRANEWWHLIFVLFISLIENQLSCIPFGEITSTQLEWRRRRIEVERWKIKWNETQCVGVYYVFKLKQGQSCHNLMIAISIHVIHTLWIIQIIVLYVYRFDFRSIQHLKNNVYAMHFTLQWLRLQFLFSRVTWAAHARLNRCRDFQTCASLQFNHNINRSFKPNFMPRTQTCFYWEKNCLNEQPTIHT